MHNAFEMSAAKCDKYSEVLAFWYNRITIFLIRRKDETETSMMSAGARQMFVQVSVCVKPAITYFIRIFQTYNILKCHDNTHPLNQENKHIF